MARATAVVGIQSLAQELLHATGTAKKGEKKVEKKESWLWEEGAEKYLLPLPLPLLDQSSEIQPLGTL